MTKFKFKKLHNDHDRLRDDEFLMDSCSKIEIGKPVILTGPPRDISLGSRQVNTSPVVSFKENGGEIIVETESGSIYLIREIEVDDGG